MTTIIRRPNADGTPSSYPWFPTTEPDHYDEVDEDIPDEDTTIIATQEDLATRVDRFLKAALGLPAGSTINSVKVCGRARRDDGGASCSPSFTLGLRIGITDYVAAAHLLSGTAYANYSDIWTTNPATGNPWTESDIDNLQIYVRGISCRRLIGGIWFYDCVYCTQIWLEVDYTAPAAAAPKGFGDGLIMIFGS